jgi:hypothetical protein
MNEFMNKRDTKAILDELLLSTPEVSYGMVISGSRQLYRFPSKSLSRRNLKTAWIFWRASKRWGKLISKLMAVSVRKPVEEIVIKLSPTGVHIFMIPIADDAYLVVLAEKPSLGSLVAIQRHRTAKKLDELL